MQPSLLLRFTADDESHTIRPVAERVFDGGDVARKLRGKRTKTKIAELADLRRQTVASFEESPGKAQPETVRRLAKVYEMTAQELREAVGIAGIPADTPRIQPDAKPPEVAHKLPVVPSGTVQPGGRTPAHQGADLELEAYRMLTEAQGRVFAALVHMTDEQAREVDRFIQDGGHRRGLHPDKDAHSGG